VHSSVAGRTKRDSIVGVVGAAIAESRDVMNVRAGEVARIAASRNLASISRAQQSEAANSRIALDIAGDALPPNRRKLPEAGGVCRYRFMAISCCPTTPEAKNRARIFDEPVLVIAARGATLSTLRSSLLQKDDTDLTAVHCLKARNHCARFPPHRVRPVPFASINVCEYWAAGLYDVVVPNIQNNCSVFRCSDPRNIA
jgi:hypothetical protein